MTTRATGPTCHCGKVARCFYVVFNRDGKHTPDICYPLHGWVEDADAWYVREVERMKDRAPA